MDWETLVPIVAAAGLGYLGRWLQDRLSWKKQRKLEELGVFEQWVHHFASYMRSLHWLVEDFVGIQRRAEQSAQLIAEDATLPNIYLQNLGNHGTELDNSAIHVLQLSRRYPKIEPLIAELARQLKQVENDFLVPYVEFHDLTEPLDVETDKHKYSEIVERYKRPLTDGVISSRKVFAATWPKVAETHDLIWKLK